MKIKTSELTGPALDWAVATIEGYGGLRRNPHAFDQSLIMNRKDGQCVLFSTLKYSTDWSLGGPLVGKARINLVCVEGDYNPERAGTPEAFSTYWVAEVGRLRPTETYGPQGDNWGAVFQVDGDQPITGPTPLVAAMRCYCCAELGAEIEIPDELTH